ncbi:MAG: heteropolysaccharide repeat-containing protein [Erysipelotrichaceae bacterium]|nr:MAG: heteropolysaccharide repeat-containing protein [Erysipelotrichaceae bacterium]
MQEYGYWQLYAFYTSFVGFLHFGWNDGIYLRYGGQDYKQLDKKLFFSQFYMLIIFELLIGIMIILMTLLWITDVERNFIILMSVFSMFILNVRYFLFFVLQATNRIKEFSKLTILDRVLYAVILVIMLVLGVRDYRYLIYAELLARGITLVFTMFSCREIAFAKLKSFTFTFSEMRKNISVGVKLMFATIASLLIMGVVRFFIERSWDIATFGKVSLTISISNLMMVFITTVGIVIYPLLRRAKHEDLADIYQLIRNLLSPFLLGVLIFFNPLRYLLLQWLPNYAESIKYMAIIFPIVVYEGLMSLLVNTFFKTIRAEAKLLHFNVITLALSVILTIISTIVLHNLELSIVSILVLLATRCILSELWITHKLGIDIRIEIVKEALMTIGFVISSLVLNPLDGWLVFTLLYVIYLITKRKSLKHAINEIVHMMKVST